jgi:hypothetical protein
MTQFVGMTPLPQHQPVAIVAAEGRHYDLHNEGSFERLEVIRSEARVAIYWKIKTESGASSLKNTALLAFELTDVTGCSIKGQLLPQRQGVVANGLDFIEYGEDPQRSGFVRFVFDNEAEIEVHADKCELLIVAAGPEKGFGTTS